MIPFSPQTRPFRPSLLVSEPRNGSLATQDSIGSPERALASPPVGLIFDTGIGNDVDDAMALSMIHALQSRGECRLLAVSITKDNEYAAPMVDLLNTFYGRGDIPIGVVHQGVTPQDGKYLRQMVTATCSSRRRRSSRFAKRR
jgi:hypothetical protein